MILLDTNVLIEILKGDTATRTRVETISGPVALSSISAMELFYGALNKAELRKLQRFIALFHIVHLSESISRRALALVSGYSKSHGLDIPDALIAASVLELQASLMTFNKKDFRFIPGLPLV